MGKKSKTLSPSNKSKHDKKQSLNTLIKVLKPRVYITDFANFKDLVQELTGNRTVSPVSSPPDPSRFVTPQASLPAVEVDQDHGVPAVQVDQDRWVYDQENNVELSFEGYSSCFSSGLEESPDQIDLLPLPEYSCEYSMEDSLGSAHQKMNFSSMEYGDLESLLMEMDSISSSHAYGECYSYDQMIQEQVCVEDYEFVVSSLV